MFDVADTAYDRYMGRYSTRLGPLFADFAGVRSGDRVLDVGAGTGALTGELLRRGARVAAADPSPSFVATLQRRHPGVDVRTAGAEALPWPDASFDVVLAQLVVAFMPDGPAGIARMRQVVRPGGVVAACMWDRDGMELLAATLRTQRALSATPPSESTRYRTRADIEALFPPGPFEDVRTELLSVESAYEDFADLWSTLLGGVGPSGAWIQSLGPEAREAARVELSRQLGDPVGSFRLTGRAWATRGVRTSV